MKYILGEIDCGEVIICFLRVIKRKVYKLNNLPFFYDSEI